MYTYIGSKCLTNVTGAQWTTPSIENALLRDVFFNYSKVFISVENSFTNQVIYVAMDTYRSSHMSYSGSVGEWLEMMENVTLNTVEVWPSDGYQYVKYVNLNRQRFKMTPTLVGTDLPNNYSGVKPNLQISRSFVNTNVSFLHTHCLVTVNGYVHATFHDSISPDHCYVKDACTSAAIARINNVGAVSFNNIGELFKIRIDPEAILPINVGQPLIDGLQFTIEAPDSIPVVAGKALFLVLGGYMIFIENNKLSMIGDNTFRLNLRNINYVEKILESKRYIDLSPLGLTENPEYIGAVNQDELFSDEVIKNYLTLSQSFLVVLDASEFGIDKIAVKNMNAPGLFTSYTEPLYPMFVGYGRLAEYWKRQEGGRWTMTVTDSFTRDYILSQAPAVNNGSWVNDSTWVNSYSISNRAVMLELGAKQPL